MVTEPNSKDKREPQDTAEVHKCYGTDCHKFSCGTDLYTVLSNWAQAPVEPSLYNLSPGPIKLHDSEEMIIILQVWVLKTGFFQVLTKKLVCVL